MADKKKKNKEKVKERSKEKDSSVTSIVNGVFGDGSIFKFSDNPINVEFLSTGIYDLDIALGGGIPKGRIIEIYGPEASGKTTLALHFIRMMQEAGGVAAFIDAEHALDPTWAADIIKVDIDNLYISQPDCGENALDIAETLVGTKKVDIIVIDSVSALVPRKELEGDMGDSHMGLHARLMSQALRKLSGITHDNNVIVIFINQIRMKIGVMFGNPETTSGGRALAFYASQRLDIRRKSTLKVGEKKVANLTGVKVVKNKVAPPFRYCEYELNFTEGIDIDKGLILAGLNKGIIKIRDKDKKHHIVYRKKSLGLFGQANIKKLNKEKIATVRDDIMKELKGEKGGGKVVL